MGQKPKIGIIIGTTRQGRFADSPTNWIAAIAGKRADADFEVVDLRDYPMPFFEEKGSPFYVPPENGAAQKWGAKMDSLDGYIFITAEYNHSVSGVLKNALDYAYKEFNRKPATFVAYGGTKKEAGEVLKAGWNAHRSSYDKGVVAPWREFSGDVNYSEITMGVPYRDSDTI